MPPHDHAAGKYCLKPHLKTKDKKRRFSRCVDDDENTLYFTERLSIS
jgi:hypothetical protein